MDGNISFDLTSLVFMLIEKYGVAGFAISFFAYFFWLYAKKIDALIKICNKMFGAVSTFANKQMEEQSNKERRDDD